MMSKQKRCALRGEIEKLNDVIDRLNTAYGCRHVKPYRVIAIKPITIAKVLGLIAGVILIGGLLGIWTAHMLFWAIVAICDFVFAGHSGKFYKGYTVVSYARGDMMLVGDALETYGKRLREYVDLKVEFKPLVRKFEVLGKLIEHELGGKLEVVMAPERFLVEGSLHEDGAYSFGYDLTRHGVYDELALEVIKELRRKEEQQRGLVELEERLAEYADDE